MIYCGCWWNFSIYPEWWWKLLKFPEFMWTLMIYPERWWMLMIYPKCCRMCMPMQVNDSLWKLDYNSKLLWILIDVNDLLRILVMSVIHSECRRKLMIYTWRLWKLMISEFLWMFIMLKIYSVFRLMSEIFLNAR